ncbi:MAG: hypothetical protein HY359_03340 [Candidatus Rokubacteria bacterium]|nr:hypothetical protein [Candidatus Rokubacteria bacterium]
MPVNDAPVTRCVACGEPLAETWRDPEPLCPRCGLERELFDREARWESLDARRRPSRG